MIRRIRPSRLDTWIAYGLVAIVGSAPLTVGVLSLIGALSGYLLGQSTSSLTPFRHGVVGAILGAFLGAQFSAERMIKRKAWSVTVRAIIGVVAGAAIGMIVSDSLVTICGFSLVLAVLGAWGGPVLRHLNFP